VACSPPAVPGTTAEVPAIAQQLPDRGATAVLRGTPGATVLGCLLAWVDQAGRDLNSRVAEVKPPRVPVRRSAGPKNGTRAGCRPKGGRLGPSREAGSMNFEFGCRQGRDTTHRAFGAVGRNDGTGDDFRTQNDLVNPPSSLSRSSVETSAGLQRTPPTGRSNRSS